MVTPVTHTVGTTGRDYATLAALYADMGVGISTNLVSDDEDWTIDVYNDGLITETAKSDFNVALASGQTDATHGIIIKPATGEGFRDTLTASDALKYYGTSKGAAFSGGPAFNRMIDASDYFTVEGMQFKGTGNNAGFMDGENNVAAGLRHCIIETSSSKLDAVVITRGRIAENLAVFSYSTSAPLIGMLGGSPVKNCTAIRFSDASASSTETGISNGTGPITNSFAFGFNTCISSSGTQTKVAATDATGSEAGLDNLTATDQVEGMATSDIDARIKSTGALDDAGGTGGIATDILGTTRVGNGDIGAFELVVAGVSITPALDTIAIAGEAVTLSAPIAIPTPNTDTIAIAGLDVTVAIHKSIFAIGTGAISITGGTVAVLTPGEADSLPSLWMTYLASEGFTGDGLNTRLYDAFVSKASVTTEVGLADAIHAYYDLQSVSSGTVQDRTLEFLDINYPSLTGSLTDKLVQTLKDGAFFL